MTTLAPRTEGDNNHVTDSDVRWLRRTVTSWFSTNGRKYPWRETSDPYRVLVAEILLQRTRADAVPDAFRRLVQGYPTVEALAAADPNAVVELLRPLGFSHRSARLPLLAQRLVEEYGGSVPRNETALRSLPGVGRYVANAVLLLAFGERRPLVDPNVVRLVGRCFNVQSSRARPREDPTLWSLLARITPVRTPATVALGLVDLGALVCRPRPRCAVCPLRRRCSAFRRGAVTPAQVAPQPSPSQRYSKSRKASRSPN